MKKKLKNIDLFNITMNHGYVENGEVKIQIPSQYDAEKFYDLLCEALNNKGDL